MNITILDRTVYHNGERFSYGEAFMKGAYDLINRCDECCDAFYSGTTEEQRRKGISYSDRVGGTFFIIEE